MTSSFILLSSILTLLSGFLLAVKFSHQINLKQTMYKKLVSWWLILVSILLAGQCELGLPTLIALTISCCIYELSVITQQKKSIGLYLMMLMIFVIQYSIYNALWLVAIISLLVICGLFYALRYEDKNNHLVFVLASLICILGLSMTSLILVLSSGHPLEGAMGNLLFLVFISQGNDVAQYGWGTSIGKRKIAPKISPNKTWAGFIGGLITFTFVGYWLGVKLTNMSHLQSACAAAIICTLGFLGDLLVSYLKRYYKIKDTGNMLPGHGGMGDRVDSLLLSGLGFLLYLLAFTNNSFY